MNDTPDRDQEQLEAIALVGEALGPLFLSDPADEGIAQAYEAMAALEPAAATEEWPLGDAADLQRAFALIARGLADTPEDIVWEYRRLFAGPGQKAMPPWGSVYTDRECVVFGEATLALRQWMRAQGISRPGDGTEPEDHIGLMLLLLAWLARNRPALVDEYLSEHLLTWAPHFLEGVEASAVQPFFEGLALLTRTSLAAIVGLRGLQVEEPRFYR